jgi:hypothetical protein
LAIGTSQRIEDFCCSLCDDGSPARITVSIVRFEE